MPGSGFLLENMLPTTYLVELEQSIAVGCSASGNVSKGGLHSNVTRGDKNQRIHVDFLAYIGLL